MLVGTNVFCLVRRHVSFTSENHYADLHLPFGSSRFKHPYSFRTGVLPSSSDLNARADESPVPSSCLRHRYSARPFRHSEKLLGETDCQKAD